MTAQKKTCDNNCCPCCCNKRNCGPKCKCFGKTLTEGSRATICCQNFVQQDDIARSHPLEQSNQQQKRTTEIEQMDKLKKKIVKGMEAEKLIIPVNTRNHNFTQKTKLRDYELFIAFAEIAGHGSSTSKLLLLTN